MEQLPVEEDGALIGVQLKLKAVGVEVGGAAEVAEAGGVVAPGDDETVFVGQVEGVGEDALAHAPGFLVHEGGGDEDVAAGGAEAIVVEDERALVAGAVGVGEDIFIDGAVVGEEIEEDEVRAFAEEPAAVKQRRDLALVTVDEVGARLLVHARLLELHAVALGVALDLAVGEHGESGEGGEQSGDAEAFIAVAELVDGGLFVGVAHEVDVALEDVGIELDGFFEVGAVFGVFFVAEHVHEGAVVDAVHAEGADEVAFEEPEGFGEQEGAGDFGGDAIDDLAPEFGGHEGVELFLREGVFCAGGDGAGGAGEWKPEALDVALGEDHGGVKADDGEHVGDVEDGLDDVFADPVAGVIKLCGVVPGEGSSVVAVEDEACAALVMMMESKDDGGVGLVVVVVLDLDFDAAVGGDVGTVEGVAGEGTLGE